MPRHEAAILLNENQRRIIELYFKHEEQKENLLLSKIEVNELLTIDVYLKKGIHPMMYLLLYRKHEVVGDRYISLKSSMIEPSVYHIQDGEYGGSVDLWICHIEKDEQRNRYEIISPISDQLNNRMIVYYEYLRDNRLKLSDGGHTHFMATHVWGVLMEQRMEVIEATTKTRGAWYSHNAKECMMILETQELAQGVVQMVGLQRDLSRALMLKHINI